MFSDMKEQMKEQQAQCDRDQEHAALDCENTIREQEALRQLTTNSRLKSLPSKTTSHRRSQKASSSVDYPTSESLTN